MLARLFFISSVLFSPVVLAADLVASRTLKIGTILQVHDVRGNSDQSVADLVEPYIGLELKRTIYAGHRLVTNDLGPPTIVRRNDVVTMVFQSSTIGLRTQGRSLGAGGLGETIEVMNLDSRLKVRAIVAGNGLVEVSR